MVNYELYRNLSRTYLCIIPLLTAVLGFTITDVNYRIYLPVWIANLVLMLIASWILGVRNIVSGTSDNKHLAASGLLLISPWMLYSIFAGMGAPPETYVEWVSKAFEQQVRYSFLIIGGILLTFGFAILRSKIKDTNGGFFSLIGFVAIFIAMPLFILNMCYWHSFFLETLRIGEASALNTLPSWYQPVNKLFLAISIVEVSLTYLATAAFVVALKSAGWINKGASLVYIIISLFACILVALYGCYPDIVLKNGFPFYPFMIPAIPFAMPYYIGLNLLRRSAN
jgi:hypothetical protein